MTVTKTFSNLAINLRRQAEEMVAQTTEPQEALSVEGTRQTLHELRVHQIELETQNEELRLAQAELDTIRERYFDLYDLAPVGYFTINEGGRILEANFTAAKLLGYTRNDLANQLITRFILKEDQGVYYLHSNQLFGTGESQTCELQMVKKDGVPFWVRLEGAAVKDRDGAFVCRVVMSDITDSKRVDAEKEKLEVQSRQIQKAKSLGLMAGAIAHHFNNQLQVVMGNLELAVIDLPIESGAVNNLTAAMEASRRAAEMSTLMLTYLGQTPGKQETTDLSEACRRSLILLQAAAPKGTLLMADLPALGPVIHANAGQLQHVLVNLVTNAWESAGENRRGIGLTVKTVSQENIPALNRFPVDWQPLSTDYACLEVADAGCGIAEENFEKIFDPFFSTRFTGRGLGLAVVLGIVRAHHGAVIVESEPDRGSIFRVFFPILAEEVPRQPDKAVQALETEKGVTVLVIEDEKQLRYMVKEMLTLLGFTVLEAGDGVEAVEVFRRHSDEIRCVICDLTMPRMDGWETLAALRSLSPGIPFVLSSGYSEEQVMIGDHTELPQAFLGKPYRFEELTDMIRRATGK